MNCANHADASAVAYCRTCGKALCANCTRPVRGVIYCEDCLGAKMEGTTPSTTPAPFVPPPPAPGAPVYASPAPTSSGPNPALAGILAGFFPIGVGAVYCGQYAKGLAHLVIFGLLFAGIVGGEGHSGGVIALLGVAMGFFYFYQIIDAVRSARALQTGQTVPDPFGLTNVFSAGQNVDTKKIPTGAIVLIVLGALFLLSTTGLFDVSFDHIWPLLFIALGVWIWASRWGMVGTPAGCTCEKCRAQSLLGPAILVTIGVVGLIGSFRHIGIFGYAGAILLVIGGVKLFQGGARSEGHREFPPPGGRIVDGSAPPAPPVPPASPSEASHG